VKKYCGPFIISPQLFFVPLALYRKVYKLIGQFSFQFQKVLEQITTKQVLKHTQFLIPEIKNGLVSKQNFLITNYRTGAL